MKKRVICLWVCIFCLTGCAFAGDRLLGLTDLSQIQEELEALDKSENDLNTENRTDNENGIGTENGTGTGIGTGSENGSQNGTGNAADSGGIVVFEEEPVEEVNEDDSTDITSAEELARENAGITDRTVASYQPDTVSRYYYDSLSAQERKLYAELYLIMYNHAEEIIVSSVDKDEIDHVFHCVLYDHPEIFYVQGYSYTRHTLGDVITRIDFTPTYTYTKSEIESLQQQIEQRVSTILQGAASLQDDYERSLYVYENIILNTSYVLEARDNQNYCSVFLYGQSVCQGYAKAAQYLLNRLGIEATMVTGTIVESGEGHAWNLVNLDGAYYYFDSTWGDAYYTFEGSTEQTGRAPDISYEYLNITTEQLQKSHRIANIANVPTCTALTDNYYVRSGSYFTELNQDQIASVFNRAYAEGMNYVTLKSSDASVYSQLGDFLLSQQRIFDYLGGSTTVSYSNNDSSMTYTFWI